MFLSPNHFLNSSHASINAFHSICGDYSSSLPPDLEISTINTCSRSHACTYRYTHHQLTTKQFLLSCMYVTPEAQRFDLILYTHEEISV